MTEKPHPGINMHKFTVGGGFVGLLFAAGSAVIFILGFPTLWYFVAFAFALGIAIAVVLKIVSHRLSDRNKPLSILSSSEETKSMQPRERIKWRNTLKVVSDPTSA